VVDHFSKFDIRNAGLNLDGIPVFLVHVISGPDFVVPIPQVECQIWITLQVHSWRHFVERS